MRVVLRTAASALCLFLFFALIFAAVAAAQAEDEEDAAVTEEKGIPIDDDLLVSKCRVCHRQDDEGHLSRISFMRKTPEGWQTSIRRMVTLNDVSIEPAEARQMVRYLSNHLGLAPEEARPALFDAERRMIDHTYDADELTYETCKACHSMGRVLAQRRSEEEWKLLVSMHRGYYPVVDMQVFRSFEPPEDGKHPMDKAIAHLAQAFPLETPEWSAWKATMRPPRLEGTWALSGHEPGKGPLFGTVEIERGANADELRTRASWVYARSGDKVERTGQAIVYTGFQWRGRSFDASQQSLREVMFVERDWRRMSGRWFTGSYDELGIDVRLRRIGGDPIISGVAPRSLHSGTRESELRIYGANLPGDLDSGDIDLGPGLSVLSITSSSSDQVTLRVAVDEQAATGYRDLYLAGTIEQDAFSVYDQISRISVTPAAGMARVGGANFPRQLQIFEAFAFHDGPDEEPGTEDDLELGLVDAEWGLEEFAVTYDDDDLQFAGSIDQNGVFTPALDGPNPERSGNRNNVGDLWVVARYEPAGEDSRLEARAHLLVTVPLYMRFEPWRVVE